MPGDVADRESDPPVWKSKRVVPVAADDRFFGARQVGRVEDEIVVGRQPLGQQRALQGVGDVVLARVHLRRVERDRDAKRASSIEPSRRPRATSA